MRKININTYGKKLSREIDKDFCLLGIPNHFNTGDNLILEGELEFLNKYTKHNLRYVSSIHFFDSTRVGEEDIILLHGGGNFGDIWLNNELFREKIINSYKNNKIIMFPQTVYFEDKNNLKKAKRIYSNHKKLILCARDKVSYRLLKKEFTNNKILLFPDMAFFLKKSPNIIKLENKDKIKILYIKRDDHELKEYNLNGLDLKSKDWARFNSKFYKFIHILILKINLSIRKIISSSAYDSYGFIQLNSKDKIIRKGKKLLSSYDLIISTRLHGFILAYLMGKPCILLDNSYGKNSSFFYTWFHNDSKNYKFAKNGKELKNKLKDILNGK